MRARSQMVLASVLAAILVVVLAWRVVGGAGGDRDDRSTLQQPAGVPAANQSAPRDAVADVRLELVRPAGSATSEAGRNLFRFKPRVEPAAFRAQAPALAPVAPPVPQGPPPPPPIPLRLIGVFDAPASAGKVASFSDGRGNVFNARQGDIIEGRYRVLRLDRESADVAYLDGRGRQMIRLSGQ